MSSLARRSLNPRLFHDSRADDVWRDDFFGQSWKRQRQLPSSPAPSASDPASTQSTGSSASASGVLAGTSSTPFSLSASDTASSVTIAPASSTAFISTSSDTISSSVPTTTSTLSPTSITSTDDPDPPSSVTPPTTTATPTSVTSTDDPDPPSSVAPPTTTATPTSVTSTDDPDPPSSVAPPTTTTVIASTSLALSATTESDTDSPSTTISTSDTGTAPPLSTTTTESESDSPPASTVTTTTGSASVPTATSVPLSTSAADSVSSSDTTSISASVASISASSADAPSSSSVLAALPPSSSIRLSSIAPAASGSTIKTPVFSFPSITLDNNLASPAAPIQAPTGLSTPPLPPTPTTALDSTSTTLSTYIGVAAVGASPSGSLFTTTRVYTSHGTVYTSVSTGVLGTGRPVPHDFAHNAGAIVGVALGGGALLVLGVLAVFCARHRFRSRARREFLRFGAGAARARAPRRPRGAWREPIDGDSVYSLVSDSGDDHAYGDTSRSLLHAESGMREVPRAPQDDARWQTSDLLSMHDAIWMPTPPSSLSILPAADGGPRRSSDLNMPSRSSLLNPPLAPSSSAVTVTLPATPPQPQWPGLRSAITQSVFEPLPSGAAPTPFTGNTAASDPDPPPSPAPTEEPHGTVPEGLLRPSLTVLQTHSSRTFDDHVDYSRLIGAQRAGSGNTFDTASSKAGSSVQ